jgi:hypothetical protein
MSFKGNGDKPTVFLIARGLKLIQLSGCSFPLPNYYCTSTLLSLAMLVKHEHFTRLRRRLWLRHLTNHRVLLPFWPSLP